MNIPDEVIRAMDAADQETFARTNSDHEAAMAAYRVLAEWARREALNEAAQSVHDWAAVMAGPEGAYFAKIFESRIRALVEGEPK